MKLRGKPVEGSELEPLAEGIVQVCALFRLCAITLWRVHSLIGNKGYREAIILLRVVTRSCS